jgi:phosphopantothenate---cysteine ligase (CTP)
MTYPCGVHCVVTAGPTCEPLDEVRRLTNFSTGRLGTNLGQFLANRGHRVTLLLGSQATFRGQAAPAPGLEIRTFTSTADLRHALQTLAAQPVDAVFHAAAVSDFGFGKVWRRTPEGALEQVTSGKFSTRQGPLLAELVPTPKIIAELRQWYPAARLVGWKYEVEGDRPAVVAQARQQIADCRTDACVANGPAYGLGFGLVQPAGQVTHLPEPQPLFEALTLLVA